MMNWDYILGFCFIVTFSFVGIIVIRGLSWFYSHFLLYHKVRENHANIVAYKGEPDSDKKSAQDFVDLETCESDINGSLKIEEVSETRTPKILLNFEENVRKEAAETFSDKIGSVIFYSTVGNILVFFIFLGYSMIATGVLESGVRKPLLGIAVAIPFINSAIRVTALSDWKIWHHTLKFDREFRNSLQDLSVSFISSLYFIWMLLFSAYIFRGANISIPLTGQNIRWLAVLFALIIFLSFTLGIITEKILEKGVNFVEFNYETTPIEYDSNR
jgi:hypothetical protein